jgi:hypothetical protein
MDISCFDDLLHAARQQTEPQRLLLVFAGASLPAAADAEQQAQYAAGMAGELEPLMCVDKDPHAVADFQALRAEAALAGPPWALVFAAALSGRGGQAPGPGQVDQALQRLVDALKTGQLAGLIPFDRQGLAVQLG